MKPELQEKLFKEFPAIFVEKDLPMTQTAMCWGIDTGDGWFKLLHDLLTKIQFICTKANVECQASQVKEKYGTLRFYYSSAGDLHDIIGDVVQAAEIQSTYICESCGEAGNINDGGWLSVRCSLCRTKEGS